MELKLHGGEYVKGSYHNLDSVSGTDEIGQRLAMKLRAVRGGFAILPEYGSRLHLLGSVKPSERVSAAREYAVQALSDENVAIEDIAVSENKDGLVVDLRLRYGGEEFELTTEIGVIT